LTNIVDVKGGNKKQRELVKSIALYSIKQLMPKIRTLDVEFILKSKLEDDCLGQCLANTNREFEVELYKKQSLRRLLETVAHEVVHVKQYARRELTGDGFIWRGKTYSPKKVAYWDTPWEIEAHGREVGLFVRWAKEAGYADADWAQDKG
jgi:hypothetical protein|tara:strand:+ start:4375 stop:4824 length:450 start_codon:yes stop_codon:yes gene_type:complete